MKCNQCELFDWVELHDHTIQKGCRLDNMTRDINVDGCNNGQTKKVKEYYAVDDRDMWTRIYNKANT
jgi:hypothetical protein